MRCKIFLTSFHKDYIAKQNLRAMFIKKNIHRETLQYTAGQVFKPLRYNREAPYGTIRSPFTFKKSGDMFSRILVKQAQVHIFNTNMTPLVCAQIIFHVYKSSEFAIKKTIKIKVLN